MGQNIVLDKSYTKQLGQKIASGRNFLVDFHNLLSARNKNNKFLPASPKAKAGLGVQSLRPSVRLSVRPSVRPSVPKSCHRNSSETTDPIIMKLGM